MKKIQDIKEAFEGEFGDCTGYKPEHYTTWIERVLTSHTESIIKELEGMKKAPYFECHCDCCGGCEHPESLPYDDALDDMITLLKSSLQGE